MIKNILLPEKLGTYVLFPQRILGFDIGKTQVDATQVYLKGRSIIVEKHFHELLELNTQVPYNEKVSKAIAHIVAAADKSVKIHSALSSSVAVFKTLKLPFTSPEKIKLIIGYEIEPLLPFALDDAVVDFIITKTIPEEGSAEILVAAVQKQHIEQHLQYFRDAGVNLKKLSIDLFDLYALYQQIPTYAQQQGGVVLVDLGFSTTRIAYIFNGQLLMIRSLPKGTSRIIKTVSDALHITQTQVLEKMMRFGLSKSDDHTYDQAVHTAITNFWKEIQFTLNSFTVQGGTNIGLVLLLGGGAEIKELSHIVQQLTSLPTELFSLVGLLADQKIEFKNRSSIPTDMTLSLAAALPSPATSDFTLLQKEFSVDDKSLFTKQLIVACVLVLFLFAILIGQNFLQKRKLYNELSSSEQEVISTLKKQFNISKEDTNLEDIVDRAKAEVKKKQEMWFAFSSAARSSFLKYLLELSTLDKEGLGLDVEKITMSDSVLTLKARVKDIEALKVLEKELRKSKLFSYVEPQEKTEFTMRITLVKNGEY